MSNLTAGNPIHQFNFFKTTFTQYFIKFLFSNANPQQQKMTLPTFFFSMKLRQRFVPTITDVSYWFILLYDHRAYVQINTFVKPTSH